MNQQEAEQALKAWASIERDELVRAAHEAGVSKNRIHTITGIARTTIDRILEPQMLRTQTTSLTDYLTRFTADWPRYGVPRYYPAQQPVSDTRSAQEIAEELFADAEFKALKLGTFLNTPDGQLLAAAAEAITPLPYRQDLALLIDALQLAAKMQQDAARETLVKGAMVVFGTAAIVALVNGNN